MLPDGCCLWINTFYFAQVPLDPQLRWTGFPEGRTALECIIVNGTEVKRQQVPGVGVGGVFWGNTSQTRSSSSSEPHAEVSAVFTE